MKHAGLIKEAFSWISLCAGFLDKAAIHQNGSSVSSPEKVPEKTPGAWLTKLSMMAPGLRERVEGLLPLPLGLLGVFAMLGLFGLFAMLGLFGMLGLLELLGLQLAWKKKI